MKALWNRYSDAHDQTARRYRLMLAFFGHKPLVLWDFLCFSSFIEIHGMLYHVIVLSVINHGISFNCYKSCY